MGALDLIQARSELAAGFVAPRSGDTAIAAAGLERMRRLVEALGHPQRAYKTIHVAGSKGKGSTVAYAAAILTATGRKTGRYTSPHLMDWRERIAVDGVDIVEADFDRVLSYVDSAMLRLEAEHPNDPPHNAFELLTAAAFVHFREVGCDTAVIEVGIGGRFDSTNVIDSEVGIITHLSLEHVDILGSTFEDIAWNKAGIMRSGRPCISAENQDRLVALLEIQAGQAGAQLRRFGRSRDWHVRSDNWSVEANPSATFTVQIGERWFSNLRLEAPQPHQRRMAGAAVAAIASTPSLESGLSEHRINRGLSSGALPGRFEVFDLHGPVVLDVAHTDFSIHHALYGARLRYPNVPITVVLGVLSDKNPAHIANVLYGIDVVVTTAPSPRALPARILRDAMISAGRAPQLEPDPTRAFERALVDRLHGGVIVVTGSFALVAHVRRILLDRV